jgi:hypothetical protein
MNTILVLALIAAITLWAYRQYLTVQQLRAGSAPLIGATETLTPALKQQDAYQQTREEPIDGPPRSTSQPHQSAGRAGFVVTRKTLIIASLVADALDLLLVGLLPGVGWLIQGPVIAMHVAYAGPVGWAMLLELVPMMGAIPMFTVAALAYPEKK